MNILTYLPVRSTMATHRWLLQQTFRSLRLNAYYEYVHANSLHERPSGSSLVASGIGANEHNRAALARQALPHDSTFA